jgi:phosphatidylserine decarboxylase
LSRLFILLQYLVPHHGLSRLTGKLAESTWAGRWLIRWFIRRYRVDMSEAVIQDPAEFDNFNAFFTRALAPDARPIDASVGVVCPADGTISELGRIDEDRILQAKGKHYTVAQLLTDEESHRFVGGSFATVYLSPRDYHRVHMPLAGRLLRTIYVPGKLFSVNRLTADSVPGLFARNERLVCLFETDQGLMAVVLVGAMIVAGIQTVWSGQVCPGPAKSRRLTDYAGTAPPVELAKGAELGRFCLGSTAIVLFEPDAVQLDPTLQTHSSVRMGQLLAQST